MGERESRQCRLKLIFRKWFWILSLAGFWMLTPSIPDSRSKNFLNGFGNPYYLQGTKKKKKKKRLLYFKNDSNHKGFTLSIDTKTMIDI